MVTDTLMHYANCELPWRRRLAIIISRATGACTTKISTVSRRLHNVLRQNRSRTLRGLSGSIFSQLMSPRLIQLPCGCWTARVIWYMVSDRVSGLQWPCSPLLAGPGRERGTARLLRPAGPGLCTQNKPGHHWGWKCWPEIAVSCVTAIHRAGDVGQATLAPLRESIYLASTGKVLPA